MYTPEALLDAVLRQLRAEMGEILVDPWFTNACPIVLRDDVFVVEAANELFRDTLTKRFTENVTLILTELLGRMVRPLYVLGNEADRWKLECDNSLYAGYTFENFIVGNSNKFAHAAALAVSNNPARLYNPLFIYGGSGLGKTHLLFAIANSLRKKYPMFRIVYIKSEDFMNEMVEAVKTSGFTEFRAKYRQADLLLMDDVQFLSGKESLQQEFFHTFESLFQSGKQIVLTSDRPPKEIATLSDRLQTRFESGLLADVQSPDLETRMAMVKAKANNLGVDMPQKVVEYIAENITNNVRELEGAVKKIAAINGLMGSPIDLPMAQNAIKDIFKERPGLNPTPEMVLSEVSDFYSIPVEIITGKARGKEVVLPRQVATHLMRELCSMSFPEIGKIFGQHHTSVMHSVEKLNKSMDENQALKDTVNDLKKNIQSK